MQAVVMHETGNPDVLRYEQAERPQPGDGEVLIRVRAASVNALDWKYRRGLVEKQLPAVLGFDASGTVEESHAEGFAKGDEVFGMVTGGSYAEFARASAATIARKPAGLSHEQAAAIPVAGLTAWQALFDHGGLEREQSALIAGAAGGVGHFAVQFAKVAGARVIGTGSSRNRDFVLGLGVDEYVDYRQQEVAEAVSGVDVAFDTVGGETTASLLPTLREGGILVTIAGAPPTEAAQERGRARGGVLDEPELGAADSDRGPGRGGRCARGDGGDPADRGSAGARAERVRARAREDRPDGRDVMSATPCATAILPSLIWEPHRVNNADVDHWLEAYVEAWKSYDPDQIRALFTEGVQYRYHPYDEPVQGRDAVVDHGSVKATRMALPLATGKAPTTPPTEPSPSTATLRSRPAAPPTRPSQAERWRASSTTAS